MPTSTHRPRRRRHPHLHRLHHAGRHGAGPERSHRVYQRRGRPMTARLLLVPCSRFLVSGSLF
jgi:hypothetical protein